MLKKTIENPPYVSYVKAEADVTMYLYLLHVTIQKNRNFKYGWMRKTEKNFIEEEIKKMKFGKHEELKKAFLEGQLTNSNWLDSAKELYSYYMVPRDLNTLKL
tara:strand:- start:483 stop:791 length:309 start_codon:yes stop_codon:yes gene_type:complete